MKTGNYILWLPSWYPNEREPFNGDFIQRHAKAASRQNNITVIFFTEFGQTVRQELRIVDTTTHNLKEITVYVPFKPFGIRFIDRIRYNFRFYRFSAKFLETYFKQEGLPSLVHVHVPVKAGNLALWVKKKFSIPYIVSEHSSTYLEQAGKDYFKRRHWIYRLSVKRIFSEALVVTNVSKAVGQILLRLFKIKELQIIPNVVDTDLFYPHPLNKPCFTYIHVSSLTDQKNIFGILRVFKRLSSLRNDWRLFVVGPHTEEIKSTVKNEGLQDLVLLIGEVTYASVADYLNESHVMVLFSTHENFPCVVIEALCSGLPVITSDVAGIQEAVNDSNGILVEPNNEEALLQALLKVREVYGNYDLTSISKSATARFCYSNIANQFDQLYRLTLRLKET